VQADLRRRSKHRRALIELGVDQRIVVGAAEPKDGPVALTLTERERPVAYVRLDDLAQSESFRVDDVVDPDCDPVDDYQGSKANADVLQTYDDLSIDVGGSPAVSASADRLRAGSPS
jgi:hypothetical protein